MAKQIYIDENGNENLVSGTINYGSLLPMSPNDSSSMVADRIEACETAISGKADKIATGNHTVYGSWTDGYYGTARFWVPFPNADDYTITLTATKYRSNDTTMTTMTGSTIALKNDCGFLVSGDLSAANHYGAIEFTTA